MPFDLDEYFVDWELVGEDKAPRRRCSRRSCRATKSRCCSRRSARRACRRAWSRPRASCSRTCRPWSSCPARACSSTSGIARRRCACASTGAWWRRARCRSPATRSRGRSPRERDLGEIEAERAKHEEGVIGGRRTRPSLEVLDRLAREIAAHARLARAAAAARSRRPAGAHLLGGGGRLAAASRSSCASARGAAQRLAAARAASSARRFVAGGDPLLFAPAMALALRGTSRAATRMNLRQGEFAPRIDCRAVAPRGARTVALAAAALLLAGASVISRSRSIRAARRCPSGSARARERRRCRARTGDQEPARRAAGGAARLRAARRARSASIAATCRRSTC